MIQERICDERQQCEVHRKLEEDQKSPRHILTVYGLGYKLVP